MLSLDAINYKYQHWRPFPDEILTEIITTRGLSDDQMKDQAR